ncbi:MAG: prepilin-type N-terminal cleavage/methylation domain-containing protein [Candidatus Electryoneaceae bacterium]|nr:prepilin-type N-terminal cleavage/methylation domain-containing protein [Candidatus Electryoneaceae bacterium]
MLSRFKRQDSGFTLIEVLVVVVIAAILAAISVPIYIEYVKGARASDGQATIGAIYNAVKMYRQDLGEEPTSVEELEELEYLEIDEGTLRQWTFSIVGDPVQQIEAISTAEMKGGAGHTILFDAQTGKFTGYGLPSGEDN